MLKRKRINRFTNTALKRFGTFYDRLAPKRVRRFLIDSVNSGELIDEFDDKQLVFSNGLTFAIDTKGKVVITIMEGRKDKKQWLSGLSNQKDPYAE